MRCIVDIHSLSRDGITSVETFPQRGYFCSQLIDISANGLALVELNCPPVFDLFEDSFFIISEGSLDMAKDLLGEAIILLNIFFHH